LADTGGRKNRLHIRCSQKTACQGIWCRDKRVGAVAMVPAAVAQPTVNCDERGASTSIRGEPRGEADQDQSHSGNTQG